VCALLGKTSNGPRPSTTDRIKRLPYLIERDGGFLCLYCQIELSLDAFVLEHLNDVPSDNRPENHVLSCQSCNIKKITDVKLQLVATAKFQSNLKSSLDNYKYSEDLSHQEASNEIDINKRNFDLTKRFLIETIHIENQILYSESLNSCAMYCKEKTGNGSKQAVRDYIDMLTSKVGPLMVSLDENNKKIIVMRSGN